MIRTLVIIPFLLFILTGAQSLRAQCSGSGPLSPGSAASVSFSGSDFNISNVTNVFASDNNRATSTGLITLFTGETEYLQATNFGFNIPSTAIICGVVAEVEKSATGIGTVAGIGLSYVSDYSVRLVRNGTVAGNNKASAAHWTSSESYFSYGGSTDIWGVAWTPADINASNFGLAFSANIQGLAMLIPNVRVDNIRITVYYVVAILPKEILYFNAGVKNNAVVVEWKTAGIDEVTVQKSRDGKIWEMVNGSKDNILEDAAPFAGKSFYRLMLTKAGGEKIYSLVRAVEFENKLRVKVFPNPVTDYVMIRNAADRIVLTDAAGRAIPLSNEMPGATDRRLNFRMLSPGIYFLRIGQEIFSIQKK